LDARKDYGQLGLDLSDLDPDPCRQLAAWLADASAAGIEEPNAMALSTVGEAGRPSSRMVLLRGLDPHLRFFTNYLSRKGQELADNPYAAGLLWWGELNRQVRIEGRVVRVDDAISDAYFASRPLESRLASAISPQSQVIAGRAELELALEQLASRGEPPRPDHWGGYELVPDRYEFWQGRTARLHDRFVYSREGAVWSIVRLAP